MPGWRRLSGRFRATVSRLPTAAAVAIGFAVFIAFGLAVALLAPPGRDLQAECHAQCRPLHGTLVEDPTYPLSSRRLSYPLVCKCGTIP